MAILYDDDFSSYANGSFPPWGNLESINASGSPTISNSTVGVYGDVNSIAMGSTHQLRHPIMPFQDLTMVLGGSTYPGSFGVPAYQQFSVFLGLKLSVNSDVQTSLIDFTWNLHRFAGFVPCH